MFNQLGFTYYWPHPPRITNNLLNSGQVLSRHALNTKLLCCCAQLTLHFCIQCTQKICFNSVINLTLQHFPSSTARNWFTVTICRGKAMGDFRGLESPTCLQGHPWDFH